MRRNYKVIITRMEDDYTQDYHGNNLNVYLVHMMLLSFKLTNLDTKAGKGTQKLSQYILSCSEI